MRVGKFVLASSQLLTSRPLHPGSGLVLGTRNTKTKTQLLPSWIYYSSEGAGHVNYQTHRQHLNREGSVRA